MVFLPSTTIEQQSFIPVVVAKAADASTQGTWALINGAGFVQHINNNATSANGDNFTWNVDNVIAGTYTIIVFVRIAGSMGHLDVDVNGVSVATAIDNYSSTSVYYVPKIIEGCSFNNGTNTIKFTMNGKNAAASAYELMISHLVILRSA